ncbi:MAG: alpha/beta hydrolase [Desulfobacteraceae bacterium]|nr:alpha/beta hydrolase [Pseudomonadota bacterium]MBU4463921.1 alpha/beta hydrolase [Pseudomonadota bacterium]MCG2754167.1 alpha/beta hydrolase [Desulfobacteraceae bacterium]
MNILIKIVLGLFFIYFVYCCLLLLMQRQILFPRHQIVMPSDAEYNIQGMEKIWIETSGGKIETWFLRPESNRPSPAVIFAHGNAEIIDMWPATLKGFTQLGIGVLLVEYPGYGRSEGSPSQRSISEAFVAAYDILIKRKDVDSSKIILLGRSIGGGAICTLATQRPSAMLILKSTFISIRSMASKYLVPGFIVPDPFDNLSVVGSYNGPVLIIHGKNDELIPYQQGLTLYKAAKQGTLLTYDCGHNDCPPSWDKFFQDIEPMLHHAGFIKDLN